LLTKIFIGDENIIFVEDYKDLNLIIDKKEILIMKFI
jgi:hypothetical protein